jgi:hypothetical protein
MKYYLKNFGLWVEANGVRGYSCPTLKIYGMGSERALIKRMRQLLNLDKTQLAKRCIFLPEFHQVNFPVDERNNSVT